MSVTIYRHFEIVPTDLDSTDLAELIAGFIALDFSGLLANEEDRKDFAYGLVKKLIEKHPNEAALIKAELMSWEQDQ